MRVVLRFIVLMGLSGGAVNASSVELISLVEAGRTALSDSLVLAEIKARYAVALEAPEALDFMPDSVSTITMSSVATDTLDLDQEAATRLQMGFVQPILWQSKLRLAVLDADATAESNRISLFKCFKLKTRRVL
tara:strand:+ start:6256 stop:6657 length:402 start_codon:yes stop_codon:yes gene_type:complete